MQIINRKFIDLSNTLLWTGLWLLLVVVNLLCRPYLPIDETRYVSVAWEMWIRGDWLVPYLNGQPYSHKPPLLFWLFHLGWALFGVNDWWPRLVPAAISLINIYLTLYLNRLLWPRAAIRTEWIPFILLSCTLWSIFTSALMFDMLIVLCTLLGIIALINAWRGSRYAWGLLGFAIGLGILSKGPVILLQLLPIALTAPWWQSPFQVFAHINLQPPSLAHLRTTCQGTWQAWRNKQFRQGLHCWMPLCTVSRQLIQAPFNQGHTFRIWYRNVIVSVLLGILIGLLWAIPAGFMGGPTFREAIFWGQTANRIVESFAHHRPFFWYFLCLPVMFFPWLLWPPTWRVWRQVMTQLSDEGVRLCLLWIGLVLIVFSFVSGKQMHYLLPLFPAFTLLTVFLFSRFTVTYRFRDEFWPATVMIVGGVLILIAPPLDAFLSHFMDTPDWLMRLSPFTATGIILLGGITAACPLFQWRIQCLAIASILFILIFPLSIIQASGNAYDLKVVSHYIAYLQNIQIPLVHLGEYHGQYQFLGRLQKPLPVFMESSNMCRWFLEYPNGKVIGYFTPEQNGLIGITEYVQPYRSNYVAVMGHTLTPFACNKIIPLP